MKCPLCGYPRASYIQRKEKKKKREDYTAKCVKCRFEYDVRDFYDAEPVRISDNVEK